MSRRALDGQVLGPVVGLWLLGLTLCAGAEEPPSSWRPGPLDGLGSSLFESFLGWNTLYHLGAVGATAALSPTGVDSEVHAYFRDHPTFGDVGAAGAVLGAVGPVLVIGGLWSWGLWKKDSSTLGAAYAVLQASVVTLGYVTLLKLVTGRPPPDEALSGDGADALAPDVRALSRTYRFGIYRGGIFWGWPSGHTAATMAVASSLSSYYPDSLTVRLIAAGSVAYMMFAVSSFHQGGMHWFSDAVAAALFAYPIGSTIGARFRQEQNKHPPASKAAWRLLPLTGPDLVGLRLAGSF